MLFLTHSRNENPSVLIYPEFRRALAPYGVYSIHDIRKIFPKFDRRRLYEWQQKGYFEKLANQWHNFPELAKKIFFGKGLLR